MICGFPPAAPLRPFTPPSDNLYFRFLRRVALRGCQVLETGLVWPTRARPVSLSLSPSLCRPQQLLRAGVSGVPIACLARKSAAERREVGMDYNKGRPRRWIEGEKREREREEGGEGERKDVMA